MVLQIIKIPVTRKFKVAGITGQKISHLQKVKPTPSHIFLCKMKQRQDMKITCDFLLTCTSCSSFSSLSLSAVSASSRSVASVDVECSSARSAVISLSCTAQQYQQTHAVSKRTITQFVQYHPFWTPDQVGYSATLSEVQRSILNRILCFIPIPYSHMKKKCNTPTLQYYNFIPSQCSKNLKKSEKLHCNGVLKTFHVIPSMTLPLMFRHC